MASRQQFVPLCDLHHVPMERMMLEEESEEVRSFHACARRDCTRVYRDSIGYLDFIAGEFDNSRTSARACSKCGSILYLAEVVNSRKIETWDCPQAGCNFSEIYSSPSAR